MKSGSYGQSLSKILVADHKVLCMLDVHHFPRLHLERKPVYI